MEFKNIISVELSQAIKANTTPVMREGIAAKHEMSIHTLNSIINRQRRVAKSNALALIDIMRVAIAEANKAGMSLMESVNKIEREL